jgi:hypothetical protein
MMIASEKLKGSSKDGLKKGWEGFVWMVKIIFPVSFFTAIVFGLSYGTAVIVNETKNCSFTQAELENLHLSIGINHAIIEDPALFLSFGLNPFWLWVPRFMVAIVAVHVFSLWRRLFAGNRG